AGLVARNEGFGALLKGYRFRGRDPSSFAFLITSLNGINAGRDDLAVDLGLLARLGEADCREGAEAGITYLACEPEAEDPAFGAAGSHAQVEAATVGVIARRLEGRDAD